MFIMAITLCYTVGNLEEVLATPTGYPFIQIFYNSTGSYAATNAMTSIVVILSAFSCVTVMAGSSRQLFAFARDGAIPVSEPHDNACLLSGFSDIADGLIVPPMGLLCSAWI